MNPPDPLLDRLLADVVRTRKAHRLELQKRAGSPELTLSREEALGALETYISVLTERHWPVPPRMLQDLRLLRSLCGERPGRGGGRPG